MHLAEREAVFVVFRSLAASRPRPPATTTTLGAVGGAWEVRFPTGLGAPAAIRLELESWTANVEPGVKYFSGTATYTTTFQVPQEWLRSGARVLLDLGRVADLAEVSVNGKPLGTLWKPPYPLEAWASRNKLHVALAELLGTQEAMPVEAAGEGGGGRELEV